MLRHKVAAHYDPKAIAAGFRHHFAVEKHDDRAFVSRGETMRGTRLYFADAATTGYFQTLLGTGTSDEGLREVADLVAAVNVALMGFVDAFVQRRGYGYRAFSE
jgi:hypothetical protein